MGRRRSRGDGTGARIGGPLGGIALLALAAGIGAALVHRAGTGGGMAREAGGPARRDPGSAPGHRRTVPARAGAAAAPAPSSGAAEGVRDPVALLSLADDPTPENVTRLVRALFSLGDPRPAVEEILRRLAEGELGFTRENAACLVVEAALRIYRSDPFRARFGPAACADLAAEVLTYLPSIGDEAAARLARVLGKGGFLDGWVGPVVEDLLLLRPLPPWAGVIAAGYAAAAPDGTRFALDLLEGDEPGLRGVALEFLVGREGEGLPGVVERRLEETADPDERMRILDAVAAAGGPALAVPLLREWMARARREGPGLRAHRYVRALRVALREAGEDFVREQLDREGDPVLREWIVAALGVPHEGLLVDLAAGSGGGGGELRIPALVTLSTFRSDEDLGEMVAARLAEAGTRDGALDPRLFSAAKNLLPEGRLRGDAWVARAKGALWEWVRDPGVEIEIRRRALEALAPVLDERGRAEILGGGYPAELERAVRRRR